MALLNYHAFGFRLLSNKPLPFLNPLISRQAVHSVHNSTIFLNFIGNSYHLLPVLTEDSCKTNDDHGKGGTYGKVRYKHGPYTYYYFWYPDNVKFVIEFHAQRTNVWIAWPESSTLEDALTYLFSPIMGFILRLCDVISFHASVVVVEDSAVALLGVAQAGKSTTAATFARLGYPILTDDVAPLIEQADNFLIQPGYPKLCLWPNSVGALYDSPDALQRITPNWDKRHLDLNQEGYHFQQEPLPLAAIYVLNQRADDPAAPFIQSLPPRTALFTLLSHIYIRHVTDKQKHAQDFKLISRVAATVPVRAVTPHADIARLPDLCQAILDDLATLPQKSASLQVA